MTPQEFAKKIRAKYPGAYDNVPDVELTNRVIAKYPVYKSQVVMTQATNPVVSTLKGETTFPASTGGASDIPTNILKTAGNIPSSAAKMVAPVNPLATDSPVNIGSNIVNSTSALHEVYKERGAVKGTKDILGGFADTYLNIGAKIYGSIERAYNALLDNPKKAITDATTDIAKIGIEDPLFIPTLLYGGGKAVGKDTVATLGKPTATAIETAVAKATDVAEQGAVKAENLIAKGKEIINPTITPTQAVKQIAQGTTGDIKAFTKALQAVDTTGVSTFKELQAKFSAEIPKLAKQVDTELAKDTGLYKPKDLLVSGTSKGGKVIKTDYVTPALSNLKELYTKIGDKVKAKNIQEIITKANKEGLTRKEVNDISRTYGQEFGSRAFSKMGDPLTSVNAQAFENTRSGLKQVARQGVGGVEAQKLDEIMSNIYDAQKLVDKNVEAVNKLQQKIKERGLLEKAGYYIAKTADILSGGSIRGFVGGMLPRGAGYKVMNAIDIENALQKNLDVINSALKAKTNAELLKILGQNMPE